MALPVNSMAKRAYLVRAAAFEGYGALVQELGVDAAALLRKSGVDIAALSDPDRMISYPAFLLALDAARGATGMPHFGLLLATRQRMSMLGPLGFAIAEAPDLRSAIEQLNTYLHLHIQGAGAQLVVDGDTAMWRYEVYLSDVPGIRQQEDLATAIGVGMLREFLGQDWAPDLVTLERRAPLNSAPYRAAFRCPVQFEAEHNQAVFAASLLDRRLERANSQLHAILNSHLRSLDANGEQDFGTEVQQIILQAMKNGNCSLPRVAYLLGVAPRSLQRRLASANSSFRTELETVRTRVAQRYLEETGIALTSLGQMLCYSDLAAFSRAFKRVSGSSPKTWRDQHRLAR